MLWLRPLIRLEGVITHPISPGCASTYHFLE